MVLQWFYDFFRELFSTCVQLFQRFLFSWCFRLFNLFQHSCMVCSRLFYVVFLWFQGSFKLYSVVLGSLTWEKRWAHYPATVWLGSATIPQKHQQLDNFAKRFCVVRVLWRVSVVPVVQDVSVCFQFVIGCLGMFQVVLAKNNFRSPRVGSRRF